MMMDSENPRIVYADIIDHPHHQSETRAHMTLYDRAAQFSAFDALAGYSDMIAEEARITDQEIELDENAKALLNQKLSIIADLLENGHPPVISFTVYVPDQKKQGGRYEVIKDAVNFCGDMTVERDYIEKNAVLCSTGEVWKCLFIRERGQQAGILVVPVDACFVKHAAYVIG